MLTPGTQAPDFTLADQNGTPHTLSSYRGRKVILYFYPKDMTAGCLPFPLLSDPDLQVIAAYDVQKRGQDGQPAKGLIRSTYLIGENGVIEKAFGAVKAKENPAQMLKEL